MIYITLVSIAAISIGLLHNNKPSVRAIKVPVRRNNRFKK